MRATLSALLCAVILTGCTSLITCRAQRVIVEKVSYKLVTVLQCDHPQAVEASVKAAADKFGLCKQMDTMQGPVADLVCPYISSFVAGLVLNKTVPAEWGCHVEMAKDDVAALIEKACKFIPLADLKETK